MRTGTAAYAPGNKFEDLFGIHDFNESNQFFSITVESNRTDKWKNIRSDKSSLQDYWIGSGEGF